MAGNTMVETSEPIVYIDHSDVRKDSIEELKAGVQRLVDLIDARWVHAPRIRDGLNIHGYASALSSRSSDRPLVEFHRTVPTTGYHVLPPAPIPAEARPVPPRRIPSRVLHMLEVAT